MESTLGSLIPNILGGGPGAILSIFLIIIGYLVWDYRQMKKEVKDKDARIDELLEKIEKLMNDQGEMSNRHATKLVELADEYRRGTLTLADAMTGVKDALVALRQPVQH